MLKNNVLLMDIKVVKIKKKNLNAKLKEIILVKTFLIVMNIILILITYKKIRRRTKRRRSK